MAHRALCIGIDQYGGGHDLAKCVRDSQAWATLLTDLGYAVVSLTDRAATAAGIERAMTQLLLEAERGDVLVVTYSGHGSQVPDRQGDEADQLDECWCACDILTNGRGFLTDDTIHGWLAARRSGIEVTIVSDSCHSGSLTRGLCATTPRRVRYLPPSVFLPPALASRVATAPRRIATAQRFPAILLAGCEDREYSYEADEGGAFTRAAIDTYQRGITYADWMTRIRKRLPSAEYPQHPQLDCGAIEARKAALL